MTREEAIKRIEAIKRLDGRELQRMPNHEPLKNDIVAYNMAIEALRQESCEDAISRQALLDGNVFEAETREYDRVDVVSVDTINELPSVTPIRPKEELAYEDAISRKTLIETMGYYPQLGKRQCREIIDSMPSVTPVRPKGKWLDKIRKVQEPPDVSDDFYDEDYICCSNCGFESIELDKWHFCPNCGADMREDSNANSN